MRAMMSDQESGVRQFFENAAPTSYFQDDKIFSDAASDAYDEAQRILGETEPSGHEGHVDTDMLCILHAFEPYTDASLRDASLATLLAESLARFCAMDEAEAWEAFGADRS